LVLFKKIGFAISSSEITKLEEIISPWEKFIFEKLNFPTSLQFPPTFNGISTFITAFCRARDSSLSWIRTTKSPALQGSSKITKECV